MPRTHRGTTRPKVESPRSNSKLTNSHECGAARHGTATAYQMDGCIHPEARAAYNRSQAHAKIERQLGRPRTVDATGTHRRLRALMAIGWRARDIAPHLGWWSGELDTLFRRPTVHRSTAQAVARVYIQLSDTPGPSAQTRRRAERAGWPPPLAWDDDTIDNPCHNSKKQPPATPDIDDIAIERFINGDKSIRLTRAERRAAFALQLARGHSVNATAVQLGVNSIYARKYADATVSARDDREPMREAAS